VVARLPASPGRENAPAVAFLAHLDTAGDAPGKDVHPQYVPSYDGGKITLKDNTLLDPARDKDLAAHTGQAIIHTDGTTLLGSDDKAAIAEIMAAAEYLLAHPELKHGPVELVFTPDEETGKGLPQFPLDKLRAPAAYTLDWMGNNQVQRECFNALGTTVTCIGRAIHPGTARGSLVNAALMGASFAAMLPRNESPEATDGYYGYYCLIRSTGTHEKATLDIIVRDFSSQGMEKRLKVLETFARAVESQFPGGKVEIENKVQYRNMREKIEEQPLVWTLLEQALRNLEVTYTESPVRGGTDGSRLTELGIPTPNIFVGGYNFHSRTEWASVDDMTTTCKIVLELVKLWGEK
jgi:tripeptide aminopeptidase